MTGFGHSEPRPPALGLCPGQHWQQRQWGRQAAGRPQASPQVPSRLPAPSFQISQHQRLRRSSRPLCPSRSRRSHARHQPRSCHQRHRRKLRRPHPASHLQHHRQQRAPLLGEQPSLPLLPVRLAVAPQPASAQGMPAWRLASARCCAWEGSLGCDWVWEGFGALRTCQGLPACSRCCSCSYYWLGELLQMLHLVCGHNISRHPSLTGLHGVCACP